ncbi:MAG: GerMN domain-containing protein [Nitrospirota bacterium]|jgi:hypothetical protein
MKKNDSGGFRAPGTGRSGPAAGGRRGLFPLRGVVLLVLVILVCAAITAAYLFWGREGQEGAEVAPLKEEELQALVSDYISIGVYYPTERGIALEKRRVPRVVSRREMARTAMGSFLAGPSGGAETGSLVPPEAELMGVYAGSDSVIYLDLSPSFRSNFQGSALGEFRLLKAIYETITANVYGVEDVKVLIDGKEVESLGGHITLDEGLRKALSHGAEPRERRIE